MKLSDTLADTSETPFNVNSYGWPPIALKYHDLSATMDCHMYNAILVLFFLPVYRSSRDKTETYTEVTNPTTKTTDVPVSLNETYALHKIPTEEVTYEMVK